MTSNDVSQGALAADRDETGRRSDVLVVTLDDAELPSGLHALHHAAASGVTSGARLLVVDLSRLGTLSSPTVTALLWAQRRCAQHGRSVVLRGVTRRRRRMLHRAGLAGIFALEQRSAGAAS